MNGAGNEIVPIPDYQTLMLPVLKLAARGETSVPMARYGMHTSLFGKESTLKITPKGRSRIGI
jgi:restriction system protein